MATAELLGDNCDVRFRGRPVVAWKRVSVRRPAVISGCVPMEPEQGNKVKPSNDRARFVCERLTLLPLTAYAAAAVSHRETVKYPSSSVLARRSYSNACARSDHF
jgi:hypothetical protein